MPLIRVPEHTAEDLLVWEERSESIDPWWAATTAHRRRVEEAVGAIRAFVGKHPRCYAGVSWGKDSVVLAGLLQEVAPDVPLVWIRVEPIANPHCSLVRDAFLARYPAVRYEEVVTRCRWDGTEWHARGTLEEGVRVCARRHGPAHLSGVRAEESGDRQTRMQVWGLASDWTCAPLGYWIGDDIFAYLHTHDLPIHPAYAMSMGGAIQRHRLRVASLTGKRGEGHGRAEWEARYYRAALRELAKGASSGSK